MSQRVTKIVGHIAPTATNAESGSETVTVTDNRTGQSAEIPIDHGTLASKALFKNFKLRSFDPGFKATASAHSRITFINGDEGTLLYRGYPIEQLAEKSSFLEVAFLLIYGELPNQDQLAYWRSRIMKHTFIHEDVAGLMKSFRYNAHPMGMVITSMAALSTAHPEANPALAGQDVYKNLRLRNKQIHRIIGNIPTIAAYAYRHRIGRPYVTPSHQDLSYCENFMYMLDKLSNVNYRPHPRLARALEILFILHADHELNCSTQGMRHLTSSGVDVYTAVSGAAAALYGPKHGGANEAVLRMLERIGSAENVPAFVERVKRREEKLMGFGHRVYKNYDPRARIIRKVAEEVFSIVGREPLIEVATALEKYALSDSYFVERKLYPNVDFYSGLIYKAMGFPTDFFPVLFTIPRTAGWLAHWNEFLDDDENVIVRPRQIYLGEKRRDYVPTFQRSTTVSENIVSYVTAEAKRRFAADENP